jgi:transcriptional regulator with XRE-family HTH domain
VAVTVYSRLSELLLSKNMTVADLERQIGERFGVETDRRALQRLTYAEAVERVDMSLVGAAASVLEVPLGDLFEMEIVPAGGPDGLEIGDLAPDQSRQLAALLDQRARKGLSAGEQGQLEELVEEYGRRLHERLLHDRAGARGRSIETLREEAAGELARAVEWWRAAEGDAEWRRGALPPRRRRSTGAGEGDVE